MHTDSDSHVGADQIVAEAKARGVPVVSAVQMLDWLDGRNGSSFQNLSYSNQRLRFNVAGAPGSRGLQAMVPAELAAGALSSLTRNGVPVAAPSRTVKGMDYAFFDAADGNYVATYGDPGPDTAITGASVSGTTARFTFVSDAAGASFQCRRDSGAFAACASPRSTRGLHQGCAYVPRPVDRPGWARGPDARRAPVHGRQDAVPRRLRRGHWAGRGRSARCRSRRSACGSRRTAQSGSASAARRATAAAACSLSLRASRKTVASRTFLVKGGKSRVIELTLSRKIRASLARKRAVWVTAVAVSRNKAGDRAVTRKKIRLVAR